MDRALLVPTAEMIRAGLAGLVVWWDDHPDVPREEIVASAIHLLQPGARETRLKPF